MWFNVNVVSVELADIFYNFNFGTHIRNEELTANDAINFGECGVFGRGEINELKVNVKILLSFCESVIYERIKEKNSHFNKRDSVKERNQFDLNSLLTLDFPLHPNEQKLL